MEALLSTDYEIGHLLRERIVPRAVLFFTGDDEYDDEEEETDEDEEVCVCLLIYRKFDLFVCLKTVWFYLHVLRCLCTSLNLNQTLSRSFKN